MVFVALSGATAVANSCEDTPDTGEISDYGTLKGVVKDTQGEVLSGVEVGVKGTDATVSTGNDGTYVFENVPVATQLVTFRKSGYAVVGMTVPKNKFIDGVAVLNPVLEFANAKISGMVLDAQNGNVPFEGVDVSIGNKSMTTGADGKFLFEELTIQDYTLTLSKTGCASVTKELKADMFVDGIIEVDPIAMGGKEILPGLTAQDLKDAGRLYVNEYRGGYGRGGDRIDWSTSFMSAWFGFYGNPEMQNEGCTLRPVDGSPAGTDVFDSYAYGIKSITEDNKIMTVYVRTHNADAGNPAVWGVQAVDLNSVDPTAEKVGETMKHGDGSYSAYTFDLSAYVGREVVLAIGYYNDNQTWKQLCIAHVSFAAEETHNDDFLPGTEVAGLEGWHMTMEHVRSMMPNPRRTFTGIPSVGENIQSKSNPAYRGWYGTGHIASEWGFMYVSKDTEPLAGEGFVIKTRSGAQPDYATPESYFYSKFAVGSGCNRLVLSARNFDGNTATCFRLTAITEEGTVKAILPESNTAKVFSEAENGCCNFIHNENDYASFVYDLSEFDGQNVVITLGVHKGVSDNQGGEQKLCISGIELK